jgi:hypothetical protein
VSSQQPYPFALRDAFLISLEIKRKPQVPDPVQIATEFQVRINDQEYPDQFQAHLIATSSGDNAVDFRVELFARFAHQGPAEKAEEARASIPRFISEKGFHQLLPYMAQIVRIVSGQMGMNPLQMPFPDSVVAFSEEAPASGT